MMPALLVAGRWYEPLADSEMLVPPTTDRMTPRSRTMCIKRKCLLVKEVAALVLMASTKRLRMPSVASRSGERPTEPRMKMVSVRFVEGFPSAYNWQELLMMRTRQRIRV